MRRHTTNMLVLLMLAGCHAGSQNASLAAEVERMRASPAAKEASELAPEAFAHAEQERKLAEQTASSGDHEAAQLTAEHAQAAYTHAFVLARLARAMHALDAAAAARAQATEDARALAESRATVEAEGAELERQLKGAEAALAPPTSGAADAKREAARLTAARSLIAEARLLCGAARLITSAAPGLAQAESAIGDIEKRLANNTVHAPIDAAAHARVACLGSLTHARRGADSADAKLGGHADPLLAELSAQTGQAGQAGWDPRRDERGVVITLRNLFASADGAALTPQAETKLEELGHVARAHASYPVQVVVHDGPGPSSSTLDTKRGEAIIKALITGGANEANVRATLAGTHAPIVDPNDAKHRARNERVDVVFVAPQN